MESLGCVFSGPDLACICKPQMRICLDSIRKDRFVFCEFFSAPSDLKLC